MFRAAEIKDLATIVKLKIRMFDDAGHADLLKANATDEIHKKYVEMYQIGKALHFVIEECGSVVACSGAFIKEDIPYCFYKNEYYGFIGDVYVSPDYRRRGYARSLTEAAINWLKNKEVKTVRLLSTPEARNIYKEFGFVSTDEMALNI